MSSTFRERAAARARLERQMADKLERARQRKQRNAIIGAAAAVLLVVGGIVWAVTAGGDEPAAPPAAADNPCFWAPDDVTANPDLKEVGAPPSGVAPKTGTQTMTITMNTGVVEVEVNTAKAPCTAQSMTFLANQKFFDNTKCHRMVTSGIKVLQCGDPTATGRGGPTYKFAEENLPNFIDETKNYPIGTIAMANTGQPGSTGSQFFIIWGDSQLQGAYTILGKVTKGIEVVQAIGAGGATKDGKDAEDGEPKLDAGIKTITITPAAS